MVNKPEKARKIVEFLINNFQEHIAFYSGLNSYEFSQNFTDLEGSLDLYRYIIATSVEYDTEEYSTKLKDDFMTTMNLLEEVLEEQ